MNIAVTDFRGEGFLMASPTPSQGDNTFRRTSPAPALTTLTCWVLSSYNNALYVGTGNRTNNTGYGVYKTTWTQ